jgi:hypothetical protein
LTTSLIVSPLSSAFALAGNQISSGTRTERPGVAGWLGTPER